MEDRTLLATMLWANAVNGDWDIASNWVNSGNSSDHHVPTSSDDAVINYSGITVSHTSSTSDAANSLTSQAAINLSSGSLSFAAASTIADSFTMSGGTLTGAGALTISGATTWTGGTMSGTGSINADGGLTLGGASVETLAGWTLNNAGAATLSGSGPGLYLSSGALFDNQPGASFTIQTDAGIANNGGVASTFVNEGTLTKAGGTGTTTIGVTFNQTGAGTTQVQSGTLKLSGGGTIGGTGTVSPAAGATLSFAATNSTYTIQAGTGITGGGAVAFTNGTVNDAGSYTVTGSTSVSGGTANFTAPVGNLGQALTISSGTLNLSGGAQVSVPTLSMSFGTLTGSDTLTVTGALTWSGGTMSGTGSTNADGGLTLGGASSETLAGRTLNNAGAATLSGSGSGLYLSSGALFDNQPGASFTIQTDAGIAFNGGAATFVNEGALTKAGGTGTTTISVTFNQTGAGATQVQSGTLKLSGGGTFAGTVQATGGGSFTMTTAPTNLSSGTLTGATWAVGANSSISLGANVTTDATTIILDGTGASFSGLSNLADVMAGASLQILDGASLSTTANLDDAGTVSLATGTWTITGNYSQEATSALDIGVGGLAPGSQFGQLNVSGQVALDGALNISLLNGYSPPLGDSYRILTFGTRTGDFAVETGLYLAGGEAFSPTYGSSALSLVVIPEMAGTATTVTSSMDPSTYGQSVTFTATVTPTLSTDLVPTGTVTFYDGASTLGTATLNSTGVASFTTSVLIVGSHSIVAEYAGDSNFSGSNSTPLTQTINQDGSSTVVVSSLNPSIYGQSVTFTATVSAAAPGAGTPTGTVTFSDGSTSLGSATLTDGAATLTISTLTAGSHAIQASYGGDTNFMGSGSAAVNQTVNQDGSTIAVSSATDNPSVFGQAVTFTATVAAAVAGSGTPTGVVTFYDGSTVLGTAGLSGGSASYTTSTLTVGTDSITATYGGDANFAGSGSTAFAQTVNQTGTATVVTSSLNPTTIGQSITFTATVSADAPGSGTPTGTVIFYDGTTAIDTETLTNGSAAFTTANLAEGNHALSAQYGGDMDFTGGTSAAINQAVMQASSTAVVSSSVNPSVFGQAVTFTATVSAVAPGSGTPTGTVTFYDGTTAIDTETLSNGSAVFTSAALALGTHAISVQFGGDVDFTGSTSAAMTQTFNQASSTAMVSSSVNPSVFGQVVTFTVTVSAVAPGSGTPTGTVTFYDGTTAIDTEALSNASAVFTSATLALGTHAISVQYGGDVDFTGNTSATMTQTVNQASSTAMVSSSVNPSVFGQVVTFTATVSASPPATGTPTGTVTFYDGSTALDTETLGNGSASYTTSALTVGSHAISVQYGGDSVFNGTTSTATTQTVNPPPPATLNGEVYNDLNGDGSLETGELGLSGWTIRLLDTSNNIVASTTTDSSGNYSFPGVSPGSYTVASIAPSGYIPTAPDSGTLSVTAAAGQTINSLNFGEFQTATLSGELFEDSNQNGILDGGESGHSAWTVYLLNSSNDVISAVKTDSDGAYSFSNLVPGSYAITAVLQPGYIATAPASGRLAFTPTSGEQATGQNLGVFKAVSLAVTGLTTSPSTGLQSGMSVVVQWSDANTGTLPAAGSFNDLVTVFNTTTNDVLAFVLVSYDATSRGNLEAGASAPQQYAFRLPDANAGVGQIQFTVQADWTESVSTPEGNPHNIAQLTETSTLAPYPDLAVSSITPPTDAWSGRGIVVSWTITNQGTAATQGTWNDVVYLNQAGNPGPGQLLGVFPSPENLAPGQSYQRTQDFTLPQGISGNFQIIVTSDADGSIYDPNPANNTGTSGTFPVQLTPSPDLQVTAITVPPTATDGQPATFSWTVTNNGTGATNVPGWTDKVYLSPVPTLIFGAIVLGTAENPSALAPGESYTQSLTADIPGNPTGSFFVIVVADSNLGQPEYPFQNDNVLASTSVVVVQSLPTPGILQVSQVTTSPSAPSIIHGGDSLTVSWTVQNTGGSSVSAGPLSQPAWTDGISLTQNPNTSQASWTRLDTKMDYAGAGLHPVLNVGDSISETDFVQLPQYLSGTWYLVVASDVLQTAFGAVNPIGGSASVAIPITATPAPILQVDSVTAPTSGVGGQTVPVTWTISNQGFASTAAGESPQSGNGLAPPSAVQWTDSVYLSTSTVFQGATFLGSFDHFGDVSPLQSYTETQQVTLPSNVQGPFYIFVETDSGDAVFQGSPRPSDTGYDPTPVSIALPPAADLQVTSIATPLTAGSGLPISIGWTVTNTGAGTTSTTNWADELVLSADNDLTTTGDNVVLGKVDHRGSLAPGGQYTAAGTVTLPVGISGTYYLFVTADWANVAAGATGEMDNSTSIALPITLTAPPNLQVTEFQTSGLILSGQPLSIDWTVTNTGNGPTRASETSWTDRIYLSQNGVLDPINDPLLGSFTHNGGLTPGVSYTQSQAVTLPVGISGPYTLFMVVDANNQVYQASAGTIDSQALPITVTLTPPPDLEVSGISAPASGYTSQLLTINWTVTNQGTGPASPDAWDDSVYLSTDQFLDPNSAIDMGTLHHVGGLAAGASYSASLTAKVPDYASGPYYVFVRTDSGNRVFEGIATGGHEALDPTAVVVTMPLPADLAVSDVTVPSTGLAGLPASTITWTVTNIGVNSAIGAWYDNVYLSADGAWSPDDPLIAQVLHSGDLAPGASYTGQSDDPLPGVTPGNYYVIVRADALDNVRDADRSNNQLASTDTIGMNIPSLPLGQTLTPTLDAHGDLYYQFDAQAGQNFLLTNDIPQLSQAEFFIRYGAPPTLDQFDQEYPFPFDSHQELSIQDARQGTYYILLHNPGTEPVQLSILGKALAFEVDAISPSAGSNVGQATVTIAGAEFQPGAVVSLVGSDGGAHTAQQVWWKDPSTIWATFDLTGLAPGVYDVSVTDGGQTATDPGAFTVTNGAPGSVQFHFIVPGALKPGGVGKIEVVYTNTGDTDVAAPLLSLAASSSKSSSIAIPLRIPGQTAFGGSTVDFLAENPNGPAGILPPRSSFTFIVDFEVPHVPGSKVLFSLSEVSPSGIIDWPSLESTLQPPTIPFDAWDAIYTNFIAQVGSTGGQLQSALDSDATYLSQLGPVPYDLPSLVSFQLQQADDSLPTPILTSATDAADQEPGLSLVFDRSFMQPINGRYSFGPLGRGWAVPWFSSLSTDAQGNVHIQNGGTNRVFFVQPDGSFLGRPGDHASLTVNQGLYDLQETDGTVTVYQANGSFDYITDTHGNRITAVYTGSRVTSLVASNGDALTIAYNDQGLVSQLTDAFGRVTTYGYDASGQHLISVTGPGGTTTYQYSTATSGPTANELLEVGNPDGTHEYFTYDASGRLNGQSFDGAQAVSLAYDGPGGVAITDATGATTTVLFNAVGQIGEVVDALGNAVKLRYDAENNLTSILEPGGLAYAYSYDANGNVTSVTDPLGQTVNLAYAPASDRLVGLTDARGNTTNYAYDSGGDLLSITYPGGTGEQFGYDPLGNLTETVDGNGKPIQYTENAQGLVTQETFADGSTISYAYDSHQKLVSATDPTGTTTLEYDAADRLTRITYPSGMFLEFTYNAGGHRIRSIDQTGFTVNYAYDAVGRLSELTDGSGALIVIYTYDAAGRLASKYMGNGTYTIYTYDADGNVLDLVNHAAGGLVNSSFVYTYDAMGRVITETGLDGQWTYSYDAIGELTHAVFVSNNPAVVPNQDLTYSYDANGNRIETISNGVTTAYVTNALNQYTAVGSETLSYDGNGNLISTTNDGVTTTYTYDELNRLIGVSGPDGTQTYQYNALGYLSASANDGATTQYLVDPMAGIGSIVGSYDGGNNLMAHYVYGLGLTSQYGASGQAAFYDFNAAGSTVGVSGASGTYLDQYSYAPFGQTITASGILANPFTFEGQGGSVDGGNGLTAVGVRPFDAAMGRFTSPDPLQVFAGEPNTYSDHHNDPINTPVPVDVGPQMPSNDSPGPDWPQALGNGGRELGNGVFQGTPEIYTYENSEANGISNPAENPATDAANTALMMLTYPLTQLGTAVSNAEEIAPGAAAAGLQAFYRLSEGKYWRESEDWDLANEIEGMFKAVGSGATKATAPIDPNDIVGPSAYGDQNFVAASALLPYRIDFENEPTATAPAQTITITDQLDSNLEWRTFQLGEIDFGGVKIIIPAGRSFYAAQVDLRPDGINLFVRIDAGIDPTTGIVTWTLTSIDPATGEPPTDPSIGLLPPDDANGDGEGLVTYTIQPKAGSPTGTVITSQATVVFDTQPPLSTNTVTDTLDALAPSSAVAPLPVTEEEDNFTVSWSGEDDTNGSGLAFYSIYVSDNGGPFTLWLSDTTDTSATYNGQPGHTYSFYSLATDNAGNVETAPTAAEATTQVFSPTIDTTTAVQSSEDPSKLGDSVTFTATVSPALESSTPTGSVQFSVDGSPFGNPVALASGTAPVTTSSLAVGSHTISASYTSDTDQFYSSTGSLAVGQTVNTADSTTTVTTSSSSPTYGQSLVFTATVSPVTSGLPTPTGSVQFEIDGADFGTAVTLVNGSATSMAIDSLGAGAHTIAAVYAGDANFSTSIAADLTQIVSPAPLTVTANDATNVYGQPNPAFTASYSGFVLGQDPSVLGGTLSFSTPATAASHVQAGGYAITPSGLTSTNYAITFVNGTLAITPAPLTITADNKSMVYGAPLPALTASYSGFVNGDTSANLTTPVTLSTEATSSSPVGTYAIQVSGATSADYQITFLDGALTINQASTTTHLVSSANPSVFGQSVTFTATVAAMAPGAGMPTGSVTFYDNGVPIGTATLSAGVVSFNTSSLRVATHSITAVYDGDDNFTTSTSSAVGQTVNQAGTTTSLTASPTSATSGQTVTLTATIAVVAPGAGSPTGSVQFFIGTTSLGTANVSGNTAILTTTALPVGTDSLTAQYLGDPNFTVSTSSAISVTINPAIGIATTTTLTSSTNPSLFGQSVTFTSTVAPSSGSGTPTGTVTFYAGSTALGTATLSSKKASLKTTSMPVGSQAITAVYSGDTTYAPSTSAVLTQKVNQDSTTTKVTSSANPSVYGQSVTFTTTVKAASPGSGTPTGTVTFYDGTTSLGTGTLSGGTAALSTTFFVVGSHSVTAVYSGDPDFTASTSPALTQTVNQAATTTAVVSAVNPSIYGQQLTFTATVSANSPGSGTPTGTITFYSGSTQLGTGTISGGTASLTVSPQLSVGNHTIKASYGGDTNFKTSAGTLTQTVNQDSTTTSVVSSVNPSVYGQSVTFTATVAANAPGSGTPAGSVTFKNGSTTLGTVTLSGGTASNSTARLATGLDTITATYKGSSSFITSSASLNQTVSQDSTTANVSSSLNPSIYGQSVTFTATVSANSPGSGTPTGTVTFYSGSTAIGTGTLSSGKTTFKTSSLPAGSQAITAVYGGDTNFVTTTSAVLTQTVNQDSTTTKVSSSANPSVYGQSVTFTATVKAASPGSGTPTGSVEFYDGSTDLGSGTLDGTSTATFTVSTLSIGTHSITGIYSGNGNFTTSTSSAVSQKVNQASTTTALASSANPSTSGQAVTFTATISVSSPGSGTPTGTVTFYNGSTSIGTGSVSGGVATFTISSLSVGTHSIKAVYSGDTNFKTSSSSVLTQVVQSSSDAISSASMNQVVDQVIGILSTNDVQLTGSLVHDLALEQVSFGNHRLRRFAEF